MFFVKDSETSRSAAVSVLNDADTSRADVYRFIKRRGSFGATDDEVQVRLRMNGSTQRPRRVELWDAGLVIDSGVRRLTRSKRWAVVWVVRPVGTN